MSLLETRRTRAGATETLTTWPQVEALADEWRELWRRVGATPFQAPEWLLPWYRWLGGGALRVLTLREPGGRLVGLAPRVVDANPWRGGERTEWLLGTGVSDYGGVLVERGGEAALGAAIEEAWAGDEDTRWIDWQQLRGDSPLLHEGRLWRRRARVTEQEKCPVLRLTGEPRSGLPASWRKKIEYERRRFERTAAVTFERADAENVDRLWDAFVRLHGERWANAGGGVVAGAGVQAFHAEVVQGMLANGALRLYALRADGEIVASYYGFLAGARAFYYLGGFAPAWEKFGVGNLIVDHAMLEAAREGATTFDFLRGREPYKYRWGAQDEPTYRLEIRRGET